MGYLPFSTGQDGVPPQDRLGLGRLRRAVHLLRFPAGGLSCSFWDLSTKSCGIHNMPMQGLVMWATKVFCKGYLKRQNQFSALYGTNWTMSASIITCNNYKWNPAGWTKNIRCHSSHILQISRSIADHRVWKQEANTLVRDHSISYSTQFLSLSTVNLSTIHHLSFLSDVLMGMSCTEVLTLPQMSFFLQNRWVLALLPTVNIILKSLLSQPYLCNNLFTSWPELNCTAIQ